MLTPNEKRLIADALNGCNVLLTSDPKWLPMMVNYGGGCINATVTARPEGGVTVDGQFCCALEHEVYDAINLNQLDTKWRVNGVELMEKLNRMSPADRETLIHGIAGCWARNDEHFERDLDAIQV